MELKWPSGVGAVLALVALIIIVVLLVVGQLTFMPMGLILLLLALSRLM